MRRLGRRRNGRDGVFMPSICKLSALRNMRRKQGALDLNLRATGKHDRRAASSGSGCDLVLNLQ